MSERLDRLHQELTKAKEKRDALDKKIKELEEKYRERENTEIHDMVREANLTPEKLAELIRRSKIALPETRGNRLKDTEETEDED